jgi:hypothetical protein
MNLPDFAPGRNARHVHQALKQSVEILDRAHHCAVLWFGEILVRKLYRELGYSSIYQYASEELGFPTTRTGDFKRLSEKLSGLPAISAKVESGELGYTKAREIVKVADPINENAWLEVAGRQSRRELEETVRCTRKAALQKADPAQGSLVSRPPSAPPPAVKTRVGFELSPTQLARYESLMGRIGHPGNKADLLLDMMEAYLEVGENVPRGATPPRYQIHVHECPAGATRAPFLHRYAVRCWPATAINVAARVAPTTVSWISTILSAPRRGHQRSREPCHPVWRLPSSLARKRG